MLQNQNSSKPKVFFNASVILAGLKSPAGGSGKLLNWCRNQKINGVISEIVADEATRHADKIGVKPAHLQLTLKTIFSQIFDAPAEKNAIKFGKIVVDPGDAHILASCYEIKPNFLVTLDKKHLLILQGKIKWIKIVSPGELIARLE
jgi:predicted nucleic acid-binding protein